MNGNTILLDLFVANLKSEFLNEMNAEMRSFRADNEKAKTKYDFALEKGKLHAVSTLIRQIDKVYAKFLKG